MRQDIAVEAGLLARPTSGIRVKEYKYLFAVWLIFGVVDVTQRLWIDLNGEMDVDFTEDRPILTSPLLDGLKYEIYVKKLATVTSVGEKDLLVEEASSIEPSVWHSSSHKFRLVAIAKEKHVFAVFERFDASSGVSDIVDFREGSLVDGARVKSIDRKTVVLESGDGTSINLVLFESSPDSQ